MRTESCGESGHVPDCWRSICSVIKSELQGFLRGYSMPNETLKCLSGTRQGPDLPDGVNLLEDRTEKCLNKLPSYYYWPKEQLSRIDRI